MKEQLLQKALEKAEELQEAISDLLMLYENGARLIEIPASLYNKRDKLKSELASLKAEIEGKEGESNFIPMFTEGFKIDIFPVPSAIKGHATLLVHPDDEKVLRIKLVDPANVKG